MAQAAEQDEKQDVVVVEKDVIIAQAQACKATQDYETYTAEGKFKYIEKETVLSDEHFQMFNELRLHVDGVLAKKIPWEMTELSPELTSLVPAPSRGNSPEAPTPSQANAEDAKVADPDTADSDKNTDPVDESESKLSATPEMYEYLRTYAKTETLIRAITGADYRLDVAKHAVLETVQWRVSSQIDNITPDMFKDTISTKFISSFNQRDKKGHLICIFKVQEEPPEDPWTLVRAAIYFLV